MADDELNEELDLEPQGQELPANLEELDVDLENVPTTNEFQKEVLEDFDPADFELQNFILDGEVDVDLVYKHKDYISASDLEVLNQLSPGILFDLFVEPLSDNEYVVNFGNNNEADQYIGLSQLLRGYADGIAGGRLEGIRSVYVQEYPGGEVNYAERVGLAGNFYEDSTAGRQAYQEVHTNYVFEIDREEDVTVLLDDLQDEAQTEVQAILELNYLNDFDNVGEAIDVAHFQTEEAVTYDSRASKEEFLKYLYVEASLNDVDPFFALALTENVVEIADLNQFENDFQWTMRSIKEFEFVYEEQYGEPARDDYGYYTPEFVARMLRDNPLNLSPEDASLLFESYGYLTGKDFEIPEDISLDNPRPAWEDLDKVDSSGVRSIVPKGSAGSGFGYRKPVLGGSPFHKGLDIGAPAGSPAYSYAAGKVV
ncbi:hypothetical protein HN680_02170, partial [Candidatus Peregrinibacteria bacterium]|nr:hypothetical protein [Candidatus Peregrinibacteria bacterium]